MGGAIQSVTDTWIADNLGLVHHWVRKMVWDNERAKDCVGYVVLHMLSRQSLDQYMATNGATMMTFAQTCVTNATKTFLRPRAVKTWVYEPDGYLPVDVEKPVDRAVDFNRFMRWYAKSAKLGQHGITVGLNVKTMKLLMAGNPLAYVAKKMQVSRSRVIQRVHEVRTAFRAWSKDSN